MTPPVDRVTPLAPPDPPITAGEAIEIIEDVVNRITAPMRAQMRDIHELMMGVETPGGRPVPGFGHALHKTNQHLSTIELTTQVTQDALLGNDNREPMAKLVAAEVANRMVDMFEGVLKSILGRLDILEAKISGPNGSTPHDGE
jgi:hypothetical protein